MTEVLSSDVFSNKLKEEVVDKGQKEQSVGMVEEIGRTRLLVMLDVEFEHCYT